MTSVYISNVYGERLNVYGYIRRQIRKPVIKYPALQFIIKSVIKRCGTGAYHTALNGNYDILIFT